jgi:CRISPR-associated protein Cmr3
MHIFLLNPTDVLFFRDGRPMGGSSSGHGAGWPLPGVLNSAFHGVLHRANLEGVHGHNHWRGQENRGTDTRKFGSLVTAGPFPVCTHGIAHTWFFPRPLDGGNLLEPSVALVQPVYHSGGGSHSNLPAPLKYAVGSGVAPSKETAPPWWSEGAWNSYLGTQARDEAAARVFFKRDSDFSDAEHTYGIGIDPDTESTRESAFYSANYLRLREGWRLGAFAQALDKDFKDPEHGNDLLLAALGKSGGSVLIGGQQRTADCRVYPDSGGRLPLPQGKREGFMKERDKFLVKWVLLSPGIWPHIGQHEGGWLPSWINHETGAVLLKAGEQERGQREHREAWRARVKGLPSIAAKLVAAVIGKPVPVTGFALAHGAAERENGGAKSTHLAAPAGSVYYFEADTEAAARELADALNWHGPDTTCTTIRRRRSTLMGEKGFGLGVCGTWRFHAASLG